MKIKIKEIVKIIDEIDIHIVVDTNFATAHYSITIDGVILKSGMLIIEGPEYDNWGTDDNYMYDLILQKLGFERA